jgi:hypothetical protein
VAAFIGMFAGSLAPQVLKDRQDLTKHIVASA